MELIGTKCALRPWRGDDAGPLARYANNPRVSRNLCDHFPFPYSVEDAHTWIREQVALSKPPIKNFAITVANSVAGGIGFVPLEGNRRVTAVAGYWLGEPFWGRGIATEAVSMLQDHIWANFSGIHRIEASIFEWNAASCRVLEKCGFIREARLRRACIKDGGVIDLFLYARVR